MRKLVLVAVLAGAAGLGGCASHNGLDRSRPDEFAVARQAPLVIPPDYALVPPQPGAAPAQQAGASTQALDAMFGGPAARSGSENTALDQAGRERAETGIRSQAGDPQTNVVDKGAVTRDIVAAPQGDGQDARAATGTAPASAPSPAPAPAPAAAQ